MASYANGFNKETLIQRCCMVSTPYKTLGQLVEENLLPLEIETDLCDIYNLYSVVTYDKWAIYRDRTTNKLYAVGGLDGIFFFIFCTKICKPHVYSKMPNQIFRF